MSIYQTIESDHRMVEELFDELKACEDKEERYAIFAQLKDELLAHAKAEEKVFYSRLKKGETKDLIEHSLEEHQALELLCAQIQDLEPTARSFMKKVEELEEIVMDHVEEEEGVLLPKAREILGDDADNAMADRMNNEKDKLLDRGLEPVAG